MDCSFGSEESLSTAGGLWSVIRDFHFWLVKESNLVQLLMIEADRLSDPNLLLCVPRRGHEELKNRINIPKTCKRCYITIVSGDPSYNQCCRFCRHRL